MLVNPFTTNTSTLATPTSTLPTSTSCYQQQLHLLYRFEPRCAIFLPSMSFKHSTFTHFVLNATLTQMSKHRVHPARHHLAPNWLAVYHYGQVSVYKPARCLWIVPRGHCLWTLYPAESWFRSTKKHFGSKPPPKNGGPIRGSGSLVSGRPLWSAKTKNQNRKNGHFWFFSAVLAACRLPKTKI